MKRKERLRYYSLYTVIFAVLSFLVFFIFIKNGRSFVYESNGEDGIAQHYMSLVYLGNYLRDILHNLFINHKLIIPQWDMTLGLGADVITTMNYYVLGDPLNLLAVFVSPEKTEYLYTFLIALRIYLAGLVFCIADTGISDHFISCWEATYTALETLLYIQESCIRFS